MSLSRTTLTTPFTTLLLFMVFMATARFSTAVAFSSGTHIVDYAIDGIEVIGPGTTVTINNPAVVNPIFGTVPAESLAIHNSTHVVIHGGIFSSDIRIRHPMQGVPATLDIFDGTFAQVSVSLGEVNIYGGTFQQQVLGGTIAPMNVYGGTFNQLGFDSDHGAVNVYARSFTFGDTLNTEINGIFPGVNFPLDRPGESFTMTPEKTPFNFFGRYITGGALDGSVISFTTLLDGMGNFNLIIVPEPSSVALIAFAMLPLLGSTRVC